VNIDVLVRDKSYIILILRVKEALLLQKV
jgi:hypothetical protein